MVEVPGLSPESLRVACSNGQLVVSGERRERRAPGVAGFLCMERPHGRFSRAILLDSPVDELSALVKKAGPVCLLCYERDHTHCHRQMIAEVIEERDGVTVKNLAAPVIPGRA